MPRSNEQIFDLSVAEGKPKIQPDSVLDDHGRKSVSGIGGFQHPAMLLRLQQQVTLCDSPAQTPVAQLTGRQKGDISSALRFAQSNSGIRSSARF